MSVYDELPFEQPGAQGPSYTGAAGKRCRRHVWVLPEKGEDIGGGIIARRARCSRCGKEWDEQRSRRGRNARKRGNALERWVNRMLGISNRGKYGGPEDGGDSGDWISVQTKSGVAFPKTLDRWLRQVPQRAGQMRGVVLVETPGPGVRRRALLVVDLYEAAAQWGGTVEEPPE